MRLLRKSGQSRHVNLCHTKAWDVPRTAVLVSLAASLGLSAAQTVRAATATNQIRILQIENGGYVEVLTPHSTDWVPTTITNFTLGPNFRVRTGPNTRALLRWSDQTIVPMDALTELEILPPHEAKALFGMNLIKGIISFFHRDEPGRIRIITRGVSAGIDGTEFVLQVDTIGPVVRTTLSVIDGKVHVYN